MSDDGWESPTESAPTVSNSKGFTNTDDGYSGKSRVFTRNKRGGFRDNAESHKESDENFRGSNEGSRWQKVGYRASNQDRRGANRGYRGNSEEKDDAVSNSSSRDYDGNQGNDGYRGTRGNDNSFRGNNFGSRGNRGFRGNSGSYRGNNEESEGGNEGYRGNSESYRGGNDNSRGNRGFRGNRGGYRGNNEEPGGENEGYRGNRENYRGDNDSYRGNDDSRRNKEDNRGNNEGFRGNNEGYRARDEVSRGSNEGYRGNNEGSRGNNEGQRERGKFVPRTSESDKNKTWQKTEGGNTYSKWNTDRDSENSISMEVLNSKIGMIIGRGGSKITELQEESNTKIIIAREEIDGKKCVKILGSADGTQKAKNLIEELISESGGSNRTVDNSYGNDESISTDIDETPKKVVPFGSINWKELCEESERQTREKWAKCAPIIKNFYKEDPSVTRMTPSDVAKFREESNNIVVNRIFSDKKGYKAIPNPVKTFEQCFGKQWPDIIKEIKKMKFEKPSPIQSQAWPVLLSGDDLIGIAQTGTGKTLAFLLPALIHIEGQGVPRGERKGPSVLVLAPTRELALQIENEVKKYNYHGIKAVCVYGGGSRREQIDVVTHGVEIIIATPGRLNDLVQAGFVKVSTITYLVLDEADRMLDMGFEPQIRKVLLDIRPDRQTVMTSATWPAGVRRLAESYMDNPVQVYVGSLDLAAVHSVTQTVIMMNDDQDEKFNTFLSWVNGLQPDDKVIVFCGTKARVDHISSELTLMLIDCQSLHGDREQCDREQALMDIVNGSVQILVATDVASRGIDIRDLTHVLNYDFPRNIEEYVHRVGRTGRAGKTGESISYFTRGDWASAKELINILEEAGQYVPEDLISMSERYDSWKDRNQDRNGSNLKKGGGRFTGTKGRRW